jgi:PAT family beta-lactamase induction signal transducer AmpG
MKSALGILEPYWDRRVISIFFFGFSSGLPLPLVTTTFATWLREEKVSLETIGLLSLISLAYALKFLWAFIFDSVGLPFLCTALGRRRSWLIVTQLLLLLAILGLAHTDPSSSLAFQVALALMVAFLSATQDILVDAYRTEILEERRLGAGAAMVQFGYRFGMLVGGALCLILADNVGFGKAYATMSLFVGVGILATLLSKEPSVVLQKRQSLVSTVIAPLLDLLRRQNGILVLLFVSFYQLGVSMLGVMANPFYIDLGFSKTEIGTVSKVFGLAMTLLGTFVAGVMVSRFGIKKTLVIGGFLQAFSHLTFTLLALSGPSLDMFAFVIAVENTSGGLASGAFVAFLSSMCNRSFTATQYALLSSLAALFGKIAGSQSGYFASALGWPLFFFVTFIFALPGLFFLFLILRREKLQSALL